MGTGPDALYLGFDSELYSDERAKVRLISMMRHRVYAKEYQCLTRAFAAGAASVAARDHRALCNGS